MYIALEKGEYTSIIASAKTKEGLFEALIDAGEDQESIKSLDIYTLSEPQALKLTLDVS
tara:strand:- start:2903 stop:3079 length:177 start_codon:yes stop_codon:yes gene_type:complete